MKLKLKISKTTWFLSVIVLLGLAFRLLSIQDNNIIIGFDQARDLFSAKTIWTHKDLKIIGPTAGNNTDLHHGILWSYFILPPIILFGGNPYFVSFWNSLFNLGAVVSIYFLAKSVFKSSKTGLISAFLAAVSIYFVEYSSWLSNPSPTLLTVPLFFFGVWKYAREKHWGLVVAFISLGLSIQFELFFIYLIPIFLLLCFILKLKFPDLKTLTFSVMGFCIVTSTMIVTEIKYNFSGIASILGAGSDVGGGEDKLVNVPKYVDRFLLTFSQTLFPQSLDLGRIVGILTVLAFLFLVIKNFKDKKKVKPYVFILVYLLSSSIMLFLGYHDAPWFLIGLSPAIIVSVGFLMSKINNNYLLGLVLLLIGILNYQTLSGTKGVGQPLLGPDRASIMAKQLETIDYTYRASEGESFAVNTLTNPLYINAVWGYHYDWFDKIYGYKPSWGGGDQLYPYNTLESMTGREKYLYLIFDTTPRVPYVHTLLMQKWANERSELIEEKGFGGIKVEKRLFTSR